LAEWMITDEKGVMELGGICATLFAEAI